jgi:hypothetical protein
MRRVMMGISVVAVGVLSSVAWGQGAPSAMEKPAKTTWQQYPDATKPSAPKLSSAANMPSLPSGGEPGSRVIVYNKPANEIQAVQAERPVDPKPAVPMPLPKIGTEDKTPAVPAPTLKPIRTEQDVFRLLSDNELTIEVGAYIDELNEADYQTRLKEYQKNLRENPLTPTKAPSRPKQTQPTEFLVLDSKLPSKTMPVTKANYSPKFATLEPGYVVHRRLYFEDKNSERYGWDLGMVQPALSAGYFFKDVLFWPHKLASNLQTRYDTSAGKCPPGSPVAYYLYPPELSFGGGMIGTGVVLGTIFLMP